MALLDDVGEVFESAHRDRHGAPGPDRIDRVLVCAALVHRDLVRIAVRSPMAVAKKRSAAAMSRLVVCQKKVDGPCPANPQRGRGFQTPMTLIHVSCIRQLPLLELEHAT